MSRLLGRGGSALPGLVALGVDPLLIDRLVRRLPEGVVVVTGTNGKTTTTKMLVRILEAAGKRVITNPTGSNLARGVATRLIEAADRKGNLAADLAILEIDEAAVRGLGAALKPRCLVVTNLARDQLDRYGELNTTAAHIRAALEHSALAVLNADDPLVSGLAGTAGEDRFFAAAPSIRARMPDDRSLYGESRGDAATSDLLIEAADARDRGQRIKLTQPGGDVIETELQVGGVFNAYNAAAAALTAITLGADQATVAAVLPQVEAAWGRGQMILYRGRRVHVLLVKNPAGFNQAISLLAEVPSGAPVLIAINDLTADGRDVSWLWDAAVEGLAPTGHLFATTGTRALDMAVRLKYAGIECWWESDLASALERFIDGVGADETAYVVPTYTAMLSLLGQLMPDTHRREAWA